MSDSMLEIRLVLEAPCADASWLGVSPERGSLDSCDVLMPSSSAVFVIAGTRR
jgi:hypothetical protein